MKLFLKLFLLAIGLIACSGTSKSDEEPILAYIVDPKSQDIRFYWKDESGQPLRSLQKLKDYVESKNQALVFATNGGMFNSNYAPQGLFIQDGKALAPLDTSKGSGNFYMKHNGVFYLTTDKQPHICKRTKFVDSKNIQYATQSGPMLLIDGKIHSDFKQGSSNLNIRNGVGILPDNKLIFAMSRGKINFYDFALFFQKLGCKNALYLDGFVSKTYLPEQNWVQTDGNFGVMIAVTK